MDERVISETETLASAFGADGGAPSGVPSDARRYIPRGAERCYLRIGPRGRPDGESVYMAMESLLNPVQEEVAAGRSDRATVIKKAKESLHYHSRFVHVRPKTAETSNDFPAPKQEPFLEPRASGTWNRKQVVAKKL